MFVTAPPRRTAPAPAAAPCLTGVSHLTFGPEDGRHVTEYPPRAAALRYLADMVTQHGVPYSEQSFIAGNNNSYAYLGERVLAASGAAPDLMLIAHAAPDCEPGRSLSGHLSTLCAGEPLVFAISDQGELCPFSALGILRGYLTAGWRNNALLLILDQSTQPFPGIRPPADERVDHAIGLSFGPGTGSGGLALSGVTQRFGIPPAGLTEALAAMADDLSIVDDQTTVITTDAVLTHAEPPAGRVRLAGSGPRCIPPWATLAALVDEGVPGRVVLIEYDESLAGLAIAVFDAPADPEAVQ